MTKAPSIAPQPKPARTLDEIVRSGFLTVGVNVDIPPTAMHDEAGRLVGFDVDVAGRLAGLLGVEPRLVLTEAWERVPFLQSATADIVLAGFARTPARAMLVDFSLPVMTEKLALMTREECGFRHWRDLDDPGVTLGIAGGTTAMDFARRAFPAARILEAFDHKEQVAMVGDGRAHASLNIAPMNMIHTRRFPEVKWTIIETEAPTSYDCAGVQKGNAGLLRWLNTAIFDLQNSGQLQEAWRRWFGALPYGLEPDPCF